MSERTEGSKPSLLALHGLSRTYGDGVGATQSLRAVTLEIQAGEFVAIVGPSGAGKSTLLNILGLLDRPSEGSYVFDGVETGTLTERERDRIRNEHIGFVFQDSHMLLDDTAAGNAALALQVRGVSMSERRRRVGRALAALGVKHREAELTSRLSGGERQRVAIARAIAGQPSLILADEPTGALDSANARNIIERLRALNARGTTVVVITHDPVVAAAAQRRIEIVDGIIRDDSFQIWPTHLPQPVIERWKPPRRTLPSYRGAVVGELQSALAGLAGNVGRTLLLLAAFALGSGGLVASVGISHSAAAQIADRLTAASLDELTVRFRDSNGYDPELYSPASSARVAIHTLAPVEGTGFVARIPKAVAPLRLLPPSTPGDTHRGPVLVADLAFLRLQHASIDPAHAAALLDNDWNGAVALIGRGAAEKLGVSGLGPGSLVWLGERRIDIVGYIDDPGRHSSLADAVVISPGAVEGLALDDPRVVVRTEPGYTAAVADAVPLAVRPDKRSEVRVDTVADLRNLQRGVGDDLSVLVGTVSVLILVLAALMSAVAMFMSVHVRAAQIALRRAVGASRASIARLFLFEGALVGAGGGIAGAALGLLGVVLFCLTQRWVPTLHPFITVLGAVSGAASGLVSAAFPAVVAARQDPAKGIKG